MLSTEKTPTAVSGPPMADEAINERSLASSDKPLSDAAYRKLIWKLDSRLLPPLFLLWFISLIDRVNIGTARIQGLEKDLKMDPRSNQFNIATIVVFAGLVLAETPSNYLVKKWQPRAVLCGECVLLGLFTIGQGLVTTYGGLIAMRFIIGLLEAGLIPGSIFLLSTYYPRYELQWRVSMLHVGNATSNAFGGLIAYGVASIRSSNGWNGWRWIFVIEGTITIGVTLLCWAFVPNWPSTAKWLTTSERETLQHRIRQDGIVGRMDKLDQKAVIRCIRDWKVYVSSFIIIGIITSVYSCTLFAPTIIHVLRPTYTPKQVQGLVIPIFVVASVSTLIMAYASDKLKHRSGFAMLGCVITIAGYIILLQGKSVSVNARYGALYLVASGSFAALPAAWMLLLNNVSGSYKTAFAVGMEIGLGNVGGFVASTSFPAKSGPLYLPGFRTACGLICAALALVGIYVLGLWLENREKRRGKRDHLLDEQGDNLGDDHPQFIFTY